MIFVQKDAKWKDFAEFIADAKKRPDMITYSSSGPFGPTHLPTEMLQQATGTQMRHVPTNGGAPAMNMLVGGHVDLFFTAPALAAQFVEAGKLRALAASGANARRRISLGADAERARRRSRIRGLGRPVHAEGVPANIRKIVDDAVGKIAADPAFQAMVAKTGSTLAYQNAARLPGLVGQGRRA